MNQIYARVILDSIDSLDQRITTLELYFPRIILAEFNTHRKLSRNASSSRAIPFNKMIESIEASFYEPDDVRVNQKGMQGFNKLENPKLLNYYWYHRQIWQTVKSITQTMHALLNPHKQHINRYLEPFMYVKVICTSTEWKNFLSQRDHEEAFPDIQTLAKCISEALSNSKPELLKRGDWHIPYILEHEQSLDLITKIMISIARCARVSYHNFETNDVNAAKDVELFFKLFHADPPHASPFEHIAYCTDDISLQYFDINGRFIQINKFYNFDGWMSFRFLFQSFDLIKDIPKYASHIGIGEFAERFGSKFSHK